MSENVVLANEHSSRSARRPIEGTQLDELDCRLIARLQVDGRAAAAALARELGVDQRTVRSRVERLLADKVIRIAAVADPRFLGYRSMALVCGKVRTKSTHSQVVSDICALPEVDYVTLSTGRFSFQAEVMCTDDQDLQRVLEDGFLHHPEITSVEVLYYLRLHFQRAWFSDGEAAEQNRGVRPFDLDRVDQRLISLLAVDGRLTFEALAAQLGISETMARKRYRSLTQSGAMRVIAIANPLHLGYSASCWVAITCTPTGHMTAVAEALTKIDEVSYVVITAGSIDIMTELVCESHEHLISLIDSRVRPIIGVKRAEVWMYLDLVYKPLLPR